MPNTSSAITSSSSDICWTLSRRPGAEAEVRAGHHLEHEAERVLVGALRVGLLGLGAAPAETGREAPVARHLALHGAQQQGLRDVGEVRAGAHEERGRALRRAPASRPGTASWMAVTAARISAAPTTAVPAGVTGLVAPRIGIGYSIIGMPASPSSSASSMPNRSMCSGLTVQRMTEKVGRALSSARPARHGLGHADQRPRLCRVLDADDDAVLARGAHAGVELVQDAALLGRVLGGHQGRGGGEVVEALDDARGFVDVLLDALPHAAVGLAHHGGAAVGGEVGVLAVDGEVELRLPAAEREGAAAGSRAPPRPRPPGCARRSSPGPRSRRGPRARRAPGRSGT